MTRFLRMLLVPLTLAACSGHPTPPENPFAPGVARSGAAVDGLTVGHRLMRAGEHELAIKAFSRAALDDGMSAEVLLGLGSAYLALGRVGEAESLLRDAVERDDSAPEAWNNLGVTLMERGRTAEAAQAFRRAYALDDGASDTIRDNLRLALAKREKSANDARTDITYKLMRRGSSDYLIRSTP